jgi:hypothetical protein
MANNQRTQQQPRSNDAKQKPVHEIRLGRIKAAIWANETDNGTRHNVTITRLYKDGDEWKTSTSFGREELPLVAKIADMAHTWIYQQGQESNGDSQQNNGDSR